MDRNALIKEFLIASVVEIFFSAIGIVTSFIPVQADIIRFFVSLAIALISGILLRSRSSENWLPMGLIVWVGTAVVLTFTVIVANVAADPPFFDNPPDTVIDVRTKSPARPTRTPRPTPTPNPCADSPHRLKPGQKAQVCTWHSLANVILRDGPSIRAREIKRLRPGAVITITGPAQCDEDSGWWYWPVRTISGYTGWMAEGGDEKDPYFLCPYP